MCGEAAFARQQRSKGSLSLLGSGKSLIFVVGFKFEIRLAWSGGSFGVGPGNSLMSNDHPFWAALGIRKGTPVRVIQHSQKCAPSAAADQTNAMARKFVEEGLGK